MNNQMSKDQAAFVAGFMKGLRSKVTMTARKTQAQNPHFDTDQVACYLNGYEDGQSHDSWRYNLLRQSMKEENDRAKQATYLQTF